ncbi:MAG: hypothetical protein AB7G44_06190 [Bacteroidia bacterium]
MSNASVTTPDEENWSKQLQKLKEKFSTLTHEEKHNEESEKDEKLKKLDIKPDETTE